MTTGLLNNIVIVSLIAVLTVNLTIGQRINTEPSGKIILTEGQPQNLLCRSGEPFLYCRFEIPGEEVQVLSKGLPSQNPNFIYYGEGLEKGQCGVTINKVSARNHGKVYCSGAVAGREISNSFDLEVALSPSPPELEFSTRPRSPDGAYEAGSEIIVRCIVRDGRPAPELHWFLNNEPITDSLSQMTVVETNQQENQNSNIPPLFTVHQDLRRVLRPEDNGKVLVCQSEHQADHEPKYVKHQLSVQYRPQPLPVLNVYGLILDRTNTINVTIPSNPRPQVEWTVDGSSIGQGQQYDRFAAYDPIDMGNGFYNITLRIAGLTLEDTTKTYNLKARNLLGQQDYQIRISSSETPANSGLDVGAIVGIVVAVAILLIIVLAIVFARVTGRWCFAAKSPKSPKSETSDTESAVMKQQQQQQHQSQQQHPVTKSSKRLPTFSALFKKRNEKFTGKDTKKDNNTSNDGQQNEDEQRLATNGGDINKDGNAGDGNDNDLKESNQLVYAELVLKPSDDKPTPTQKKSTEYAEIVYVQKPPGGNDESVKK